MPHKETGGRDEWPPPAMKEGPRDTAGTKERHTAGRGHRRQGAREQGTQAAGIDTGTPQAQTSPTGTGKGKNTHPPLPRRRRCLSALLKFAPYFSANLSLCNTILQNREIGLGNPEGDKKRSQDFLKKRGILGGIILWRANGRTRERPPVRASREGRRCPRKADN